MPCMWQTFKDGQDSCRIRDYCLELVMKFLHMAVLGGDRTNYCYKDIKNFCSNVKMGNDDLCAGKAQRAIDCILWLAGGVG